MYNINRLNKHSRVIAVVVVALGVWLQSSANIWYDIEGLFYSTTSDSTCCVVGVSENPVVNVIIPGKVTLSETIYSVTGIGECAFMHCEELSSVTIPSSVTYIGKDAFFSCSSLKEILIPNSVTHIDEYAFSRCIGLTSITIPNSVTSIGTSVFSRCSGLTEITIPNSVTSIGDRAFMECTNLTSVFLGNSVISIGEYAFQSCSHITKITIPNSVAHIEEAIFFGCGGLTDIVVESGNAVYDSRDNCNAIIETATNKLIVGCKNTVIPNSVTSIAGYAFQNCSGLTSITIPKSVTNIECAMFARCDSLISIVVESGNAVYDSRDNCNAIIETATNTLIAGCKNSVIPNTVTSINGKAFASCSGLTSVTIPNSVANIGEYAFYECNDLTSVSIGNSVAYIGHNAFLNCCGLSELVVESGNNVYDSRDNCNAIIQTATNRLIVGCKNTNIPNSVTHIGNRAFFSCSGLTSIIIPNSVVSIDEYAFMHCKELSSVTIPNSVTNIGEYAFSYCGGLTSVSIGSSVDDIGNYAFIVCDNLEYIKVLNSSPPVCNGEIFSDYDCLLEVPEGCRVAYQNADIWCNFTNIAEISGIKEIQVDEYSADEIGRYDLNGRRLVHPTPGINIIKMSNGTTRKELIR